jgi:RimJ/RimL family protein N-acetyltransferase
MLKMQKEKRGRVKVIISELTVADWADYKALRLKALADEPMAFTDSLKEAIDRVNDYWIGHLKESGQTSVSLFAKVDKKLVGMVAAIFNEKAKTKHVAELVGAYVDPGYRGQGIASALMSALLDYLRKTEGVKKTKLSVITTQKPAMSLYSKFGFQKVGQLSKEVLIDGKYFDTDIMEIFLD